MSDSRDAYRAPYGTRDVLAPESDRWQALVATFADRARRFGYGLVLTPIFEHVEVFHRVGESTDVVSKEMYEFTDRGGRQLALRPEGTASVVRAYVQHRPPVPWKCWYLAPNFRAERPQKGRYRQHYQVGAEVLGVDDPDVDVEVIALLWGFLRELGLSRTRLLLNSMGDQESRARHRAVLLEYFHDHADLLGDEMARAELNPLRILDSKRPDWQAMLDAAPRLGDHLGDESAAHFARVQDGLRALDIPFELSPRLVRGFDYYTRTTFELQSDTIDAAQNALGGGGRYDRLAEEMGGPPTPSIGFGAGIERILLACDAESVLPAPEARVEVFVVDLLGTEEATVLVHELRERGVAADRAYGGRSGKKQWAAADKSGATYGVMLAPRESEAGAVAVKDLRSGEQVEVKRSEVGEWLRERTGHQ
ncbi:MAG TPA: histidine--tRNA ligase [Acidimicrobiia bacterium]|jgi:histidyl-tRNA synthetase|nr:histidine--tRNA ligase [Acidimicrobiia bacterium]